MAITGSKSTKNTGRIRYGMVGGGQGAFIGAVHRIAARIDDKYEFVAGALSADPAKAKASGEELGLAADRIYSDFNAWPKPRPSAPMVLKPYQLSRQITCIFQWPKPSLRRASM